mgnify:FL=1
MLFRSRGRKVAACGDEPLESPPFSSTAFEDERDGRDRVEANGFFGSANVSTSANSEGMTGGGTHRPNPSRCS